MWPYRQLDVSDNSRSALAESFEKRILPALEKAAEEIQPSETAPVALDWINGRRTPNANQNLTAAMQGLSLGTDAPAIMRMLLESTAFGARAIIECFEAGGVSINKIMAIGGVARKSKIGMQILADVTNREIQVTASDQSPAIGAAVFAATAAGLYPSVFEAQKKLTAGTDRIHTPNPENVAIYEVLYQKYRKLGAFIESQI
jgi:L-ribulokinase